MLDKTNFFCYSVRLGQLSEEDGSGWIAYVPELDGCLACFGTDEVGQRVMSPSDYLELREP
jgi:hypothetical protein